LKHVAVNISHDDPETYRRVPRGKNKSKDGKEVESSSEEDDLDAINMDIYQDLVDAGKDLLEAYANVRDSRKK